MPNPNCSTLVSVSTLNNSNPKREKEVKGIETLTEREKNETAQRKLWAMNCVLCGARVFDLLIADKEEEAKEKLSNLTSEFQPNDIEYLIFRLKQLHP